MPENKPTPSSENQSTSESHLPETDVLLELLLKYAKIGLNIGVTLTVKGLLITGEVVTLEQYLEGIAQEIESGGGNQEMASLLARGYRQMRDHAQQQTSSNENHQDEDSLPPSRYIHMRNVKILIGNALVPTNRGTYWRGKLDQVDGFSLGNLS